MAIEQTAIEQYRRFNPWLRETWPTGAAAYVGPEGPIDYAMVALADRVIAGELT